MTDLSNWIIGRSSVIQAIRDLIEKVAPSDATVLISGDSGSGKELVARAIHSRSARRAAPFLEISSSAVPPEQIESELFGIERDGAGGSAGGRCGLLERAEGGTLFLDGVTGLSADMQMRLLRFLETRRFLRVGGQQEIQADERVIAATNRCPAQAVRDGGLRQDLLYRLAVFPISLAPLRERGDDVVLPAGHFPGELNARHASHDREGAIRVPIGASLAQAERWLIEATLAHSAGNKNRAAKTLGCSLKTLYNKLAIYERQAARVALECSGSPSRSGGIDDQDISC